jgi:hypothetical protein
MSRFALDPDEWVTYLPSNGFVGGGHVSKERKPRLAWVQVQEFLAAQASCQLQPNLRLHCWKPSDWLDAELAKSRLAEAQQRFGDVQAGQWTDIDVARLDEAIAFAMDDDQYPRQQLGPVDLSVTYSFIWPDFPPRLVQPKEWRKLPSHLNITFGSHKLVLQSDLNFPAPWTSQFLRDYISALETRLPVKIYDQYFKRWLPWRDGKDARTVKLPRDWRRQPTVPAG